MSTAQVDAEQSVLSLDNIIKIAEGINSWYRTFGNKTLPNGEDGHMEFSGTANGIGIIVSRSPVGNMAHNMRYGIKIIHSQCRTGNLPKQ